MVNKWLRIVHNWVGNCLQLPSNCMLCNKPTLGNQKLCFACEQHLPWLPCKVYSLKISIHVNQYVNVYSLFDYCSPIDQWIMRFKYQGNLFYAALFAHWMLRDFSLAIDKPDVLIPVPLHPLRQRERGFNQTLEIAKQLQKKIHIPIDVKSCKKNRHTESQSRFNASHRRCNMISEVFTVAPSLKGKKVLIIEDVVTTGSTLKALSRALFYQGVLQIDVWTCCRTVKKTDTKKHR